MRVRAVFTGRDDGDLSVTRPGPALDARRRTLCAEPWSWLRQVHGSRVVVVDRPGRWAGEEADAAITTTPGAVLAVHTADCGPLLLTAEDGTMVAVAHVGWRGLLGGVVEQTVAAMRRLDAGVVLRAEIGPCIRPRCYEFGAADLGAVEQRYGPTVRGITAAGRPALDLAAGVAAALGEVGIAGLRDAGVCTACSPVHWSHRGDASPQRQALIAWLEP